MGIYNGELVVMPEDIYVGLYTVVDLLSWTKSLVLHNVTQSTSPPTYSSSVTVEPSETPTLTDIHIYMYADDYLRAKYTKFPVANSEGPSPSTATGKYINLSLVKREKKTQEEADHITRLTLKGDVDQILEDSEKIEMADILKIDNSTHLVVVEGAPGIGKTTLARELCRQWANRESLEKFSLVVLHRLREEGVQSATDISHFFPCEDDPGLSTSVAEEVKKEKGKGVLFVFDGFDQLPAHYRNSSNSLLIKIITGQMLIKSTVLVTSRPSAMADLQSLFETDINRHIEIVGFSERGIQQYIENVFESSPEILSGFNTYLSANPVVKGMMYNPLNAAIIVEVYRNTSNSSKPIPHTQTQLYTELTLCLLSRHLLKATGDHLARKLPEKLDDLRSDLYQQLMKVGELAFNGKLKNEVIFKQLPEGCSDLGLLVEHTALYTRKETTSYNFFHLTHQEFMSAFYISQLSTNKQRTLFSEHNSTSMDVVWRFVAGLTKMPNIGWDEVKKSEVEKQLVVGNEVLIRPFIIRCVYEAQDLQSCNNIFGQHKLNFNSDTISNFDLYALGYCISLCANAWNVSVRTSEVGFGMLVHGMMSVEYGGGSIEELSLARSRGIADGHIPHQILQHVKILNLKGCVMFRRGFENFADRISDLPNLISLDISYNAGGDKSLVKLLQALRKHRKLQRLYM